MSRTLDSNYSVNQYNKLNTNFETLVAFVLDKYGDDLELETLLHSLDVKSRTIIPIINCKNNAALELGIESEMKRSNSNENKVEMIKPCFVKLVKLDLENPDDCTQLTVALKSETRRKDDKTFNIKSEAKAREKTLRVKGTSPRSNSIRKPYNCTYCSKTFPRRNVLRDHEFTHTGEKPYNCNHCSKAFTSSTLLRLHIRRTHIGEKPHKCNYCSKAFFNATELQSHLRTHTGEKKFVCKICNKRFNQKSNLKRHQRTHTGEKPYNCTYCSKTFAQLDVLRVHERIHTGEKPFECIFCSKRFSTMGSLRVHLYTHTGEKRYECLKCGKLYRDKKCFLNHEQRMH